MLSHGELSLRHKRPLNRSSRPSTSPRRASVPSLAASDVTRSLEKKDTDELGTGRGWLDHVRHSWASSNLWCRTPALDGRLVLYHMSVEWEISRHHEEGGVRTHLDNGEVVTVEDLLRTAPQDPVDV